MSIRKDVLKIVLVGEANVGKRSLIQQFVHRKWSTESPTTTDAPRKLIAVEEKQVTLELYAVDSIDAMTNTLNGHSPDGCLLTYDISCKDSFDKLPGLLADFYQHPLIAGPSGVAAKQPPPVIVVGNKFDLDKQSRVVEKDSAVQWVNSLKPNKSELYEASAKTADHIDTVFYRIARLALNINHNMYSGTISSKMFQQMQMYCLVDGCVQPRLHRGYCRLHSTALDRGSLMHLKSDQLLPFLFQLNSDVQKQSTTRTSPYHLTLLGAIRQLIISITKDKESTYLLYPQSEHELYKTAAQLRSPKSDRASIVSLEQTKPLALPQVFYNHNILDLNRTIVDFYHLINSPNVDKRSKKEQENDKDRIVSTIIPLEHFQGEYAPQRNKLPIIDLTVTSNQKAIPQHYNLVNKSFGRRSGDLNTGSGGKDVFICYLRDTTHEEEHSSNLSANTKGRGKDLEIILDDNQQEKQTRWNVYANGVVPPAELLCNQIDPTLLSGSSNHDHDEMQDQNTGKKAKKATSAAKKHKKKEIKIDLLAQLLPITAVNLSLILPKTREDAPFGFEIVSNMPDSSLANLNAGTQSDTQLYLSLHRAAPAPDYNLYARDLFGEGEIDKHYSDTGSHISPAHPTYNAFNQRTGSFIAGYDPTNPRQSLLLNGAGGLGDSGAGGSSLGRYNSMYLSQPNILSTINANHSDSNKLSANDLYIMSKQPLTILTEDSRSMVPNYPLGGSRGCGAPVVDVSIIHSQKEICPTDWHELNVTLLNHHAMLNTGTVGHELKFIFKIDVEPVLNKVYRPFLDILYARQNEANILGLDNTVLINFTLFCAILTSSLYSNNIQIILDTISVIKKLIKPSSTATSNPGGPMTPTEENNMDNNNSNETGDKKPAPPPPPSTERKGTVSVVSLLPPQIFNAFLHTLCDAIPMLLGMLYNKERVCLLELLEIVVNEANQILSPYTISRIVDIFSLLRSTDMVVSESNCIEDPSSSVVSLASTTAVPINTDTTTASSYILKHSLRLLKPIVTAANQSTLKQHAHNSIHLSPMARLDPSGNYPRLVELIIRQHTFDDGAVQLGRKKTTTSPDDTFSPILAPAGSSSTGNNPLPLLTKLKSFELGKPAIPLNSSNNDDLFSSRGPLPAPQPLPNFVPSSTRSSTLVTTPDTAPTAVPPPPIAASPSVRPLSPLLSSQPKKMSQQEVVQRSRTQEEVSTIINNVNNNPYDMAASLMRYLADQVVSSKIADQEIGRLQRRPYGSQPLGDLACITERLINDHHAQRNWLLDPPVGYSINPELRMKQDISMGCGTPVLASSSLLSNSSSGSLVPNTLHRTGSTVDSLILTPHVPTGIPTIESLASPIARPQDKRDSLSSLSLQSSTASAATPLQSAVAGLPTLSSLTEANSSDMANPREAVSSTIIPTSPITVKVTGSEDSQPEGTTPRAISLLQQRLQTRKNLTIDISKTDAETIRPISPTNSQQAQHAHSHAPLFVSPYTTYTRIFHDNPDINPDGTPYQWKYFKLQYIRHETEEDRRKRRKAEKAKQAELEQLQEAQMLEEHRAELALRRTTIHNTQHLWSQNLVPYKSERILLSLIIYLCKIACSDSDTSPLHASSVKSLVNIKLMEYPSLAAAYKAVSPVGLMSKDEMILRRVYALQLLHFILDKSDEFLKSNQASIHVVRRYIIPAIINNTVTLSPSMFFISLRCFVILCEKYGHECQSEIGLLLNDVFLELLISKAAPVDFKVHIFELLELILNTPTKVINLYQTQDNSGQRNVYEKLLQAVSIIILQTQYAKGDIGCLQSTTPDDGEKTLMLTTVATTATNTQNTTAAKRIEQTVHAYTSSGDTKKSQQDVAVEKLRKCALRLMMHHLHMLAQWTGVPSLKRSTDATNALKLTCKSYIHVLICSDSFPELFTSTPDYNAAVTIAAKKLQMYFEAFPALESSRPYVQMPGILEEVMRCEGEKAIRQFLGLNNGLTRNPTTFKKLLTGEWEGKGLVPKEKAVTEDTHIRSLARNVMVHHPKTGLAASNITTIAQQQALITASQSVGSLGMDGMVTPNIHGGARGSVHSGLFQPSTPSNSRHQRTSSIHSMKTPMQSPPMVNGHRGSLSNIGVGVGKSAQDIQQLTQQASTNSSTLQEDFDMDGSYIELNEEHQASLKTVYSVIKDELCVGVDKVLGDLPDTLGGLELGLDLGHYSSMDPYTISMIKKNPAFAAMLTSSNSQLSKQRNEYQRVYNEASKLAKGKDSLKEMLKFLATKYPRWLTPYNIAQLLYHNPHISPDVVGDYLSNQDDRYFNTDQFNQLRTAYTNLIDLSGMPFISALRYYLTNGGFRMPGEGQKVSRIVESFCQMFLRDNPDEFASLDIALLVCYAAILLNTELHNPNIQQMQKKNTKPPMTLPEFITNVLSAGAAGKRTDVLSLVAIYIEISCQAIEWITEDDEPNNHFDTSLTLNQLLELSNNANSPATGSVGSSLGDATSSQGNINNVNDIINADDVPNPGDLTAQAIALYNLREAVRNQARLRLLRRRALCGVRNVGALVSQRNDTTSSTQIMGILWNNVWKFYLQSIASKMDSSPFFSPQAKRSNAQASTVNVGLESFKIDEVDYETLHMCIDCLAYGCTVSIALNHHEARGHFMRALAKIVFLETQSAKVSANEGDQGDGKSKDKKAQDSDDIFSHTLSPTLQAQLQHGDHLTQQWYKNLDSLAIHSPVLACKMLLSIASNTKSNISFQRRQQILRIMEKEFGGKENINLSSDTDRAFIRKSKLIKLSSSNKKQDYTFFLFNDLLVYALEEGKDKYKVHQVLHLSLLRLKSLAHQTRPLEEKRQEIITKVNALREQLSINQNTPNSQNNQQIQIQNQQIIAELNKIIIPPQPPARFQIISPQKSFIVECQNEAEMSSWIQLLQDCITKLLVKRSDWCAKAKEAVKAGILQPDLIAFKKLTMDTKKNRVENKEDIVVSIMDAKGNIASLHNHFVHDILAYQQYIKSLPKGLVPVSIDRSLQLKKYAVFAGSSSFKLQKLYSEGWVIVNSHCKLCLRPYAFRRSSTTCQHCGEDICVDCTKKVDVLIQPLVKPRSIRACHACVGLIPSPTTADGRALIGDNQPLLLLPDEDDIVM